MAFLHFLKKKEVPDELPGLASDEIGETKQLQDYPKETKDTADQSELIKEYLKKDESVLNIKQQALPEPINKQRVNDERSFFKELQTNINQEITNLDKLETWHNNKFLPRDVVSEMKNYWEKQKNNTIVQLIGKNFQEKISQKTIKLKQLEKEWQDIYFDLIEKEEQIREEEHQLKKILSEFVELCNRRQKEQGKKR